MLALVAMYGCQSEDAAEIEVLRTQLAVLELALNEDGEIYKSLSAELGQLKQDSIDFDADYSIESGERIECMFYGLGSDGTVGANKNSIKIIGSDTDNYAQGYFVYDSKKAGAMTVSHLRFGADLIRSPYLCTKADFVACHNFSFLEKYDMLANAKDESVFLLASPYHADEVWQHMPDEIEQQIIDKKIKFYVIDAIALAEELVLQIDDHVAAHVFPLVDGAAQNLLLDAREFVGGLKRQLAVHVHLMPRDLVDPNHGLSLAQTIEPFPPRDRLLMDRQGRNLRLSFGQLSKNFSIHRWNVHSFSTTPLCQLELHCYAFGEAQLGLAL